MRRYRMAIGMVVMVGLLGTTVQAEVAQFILDLRPASAIFSPDLDGFTVARTSGFVTEVEEIGGIGSWTPSINGGLGLDFGTVNLNITGGGGYLLNGAFGGPFWQGEVSLLFESGDGHFRIGPHVGVIGLGDATWHADDAFGIDPQIDMMGNTGWKGGFILHAGGDQVAFQANIDYVDVRYDISTQSGWVARDDSGNTVTELDMSGVMVNLGILFRF